MAKHMLNALTVGLARAFADTAILVNAVDPPGETATHPERGDDTDRPASESARGVVWAATLGADGPSGGLFRDRLPLLGGRAMTEGGVSLLAGGGSWP